MSEIDERLIQYCKDNDFPIEEMGEDYFKVIENSFGYQRYLLAPALIRFKRELVRPFEGAAIHLINKIDKLLK